MGTEPRPSPGILTRRPTCAAVSAPSYRLSAGPGERFVHHRPSSRPDSLPVWIFFRGKDQHPGANKPPSQKKFMISSPPGSTTPARHDTTAPSQPHSADVNSVARETRRIASVNPNVIRGRELQVASLTCRGHHVVARADACFQGGMVMVHIHSGASRRLPRRSRDPGCFCFVMSCKGVCAQRRAG